MTLVPLSRLATYVNGRGFTPEEKSFAGLPVVRIKQMLDAGAEVDYYDGVVSPRHLVADGDLLFSWSATLAVRIWDRGPAALNQHLFNVRPREGVDRHWLRWAIEASLPKMIGMMHGSAMTHITGQMLRGVQVICPSPEKQRRIADFLDAETSRIDRLVDRKRLMLGSLTERAAALVSLATASASVQDPSKLPDGWRVLPLRRCFTSMDYGIGSKTVAEGPIAVLGMGNLDAGRIVGEVNGYVGEADFASSLLLREGDLLFNRTNSLALVGKVARWLGSPIPTTFASYLVRLRTSQIADSRYLNHLLNSGEVLGSARAMALPSIGQANLNPTRYAALRLPLPSVDEQRLIADRLDAAFEWGYAVNQLLERQLAVLAERRAALITTAVSGQLERSTAARGAA
jgi:type I restriction enzyme S subunit